MIYVTHNNQLQEVMEIYVGNIPIASLYNKNDNLFENLAQICFTNGYWVDEFPWDDNSYWMD